MKLNFIKTFGQRIAFCVITCSLLTVLVEVLTSIGLKQIGDYFRDRGYRSALMGPDGLRPETVLLWMILIGILVFLLGFYLMMKDSIAYMNQLIHQVRKIADGDFDTPITVRGKDEFSDMARNLNQMQENIKQIMERERIAEHTKNDLISSVAHDLRTPLTSIIGYLGWVRTQEDLDRETREKYIDIAYSKAKRLEQLTNELFGFVKLEHKEMSIHTGKLDLVQLIKQILDENSPGFVQNDMKVQFVSNEESLVLDADGELLARLFDNLLNNAVKYGKDGKMIRVEMEKKEELVKTRVINYGQVIPEEALESIFQKFYRVEKSRSQNTGGTGLGLAIVKQIANLHGGDVTVKSDLKGTVFEVTLPLKQKGNKNE